MSLIRIFLRSRLPWRNWLARSTVNRKVGGSSPPGSGEFCLSVLSVLFEIRMWNWKFLVDNCAFIWQGTDIQEFLGSRPSTDNFRNFVLLKIPLPGGLEPPTFRLTVERANQLRHGSCCIARVWYFGQAEFVNFCEIGATSVRKRPTKAYIRSILMFNTRC